MTYSLHTGTSEKGMYPYARSVGSLLPVHFDLLTGKDLFLAENDMQVIVFNFSSRLVYQQMIYFNRLFVDLV